LSLNLAGAVSALCYRRRAVALSVDRNEEYDAKKAWLGKLKLGQRNLEVDLWKLVDGFDRLRSHRSSSPLAICATYRWRSPAHDRFCESDHRASDRNQIGLTQLFDRPAVFLDQRTY
jgi:hypothetical protein